MLVDTTTPPGPRVVLAKMGLDSHYRGAIMVARHLVQRGIEVIYIGNALPEGIAKIAVEEDADLIGLSSLSGNHLLMVPRLFAALHKCGSEIPVVLGGVVPPVDRELLLATGVAGIFGTGSNLDDIAAFIERAARREET
jgi:methylmalonyl-CoA mutase C-terminal domain/subunit